MYSNGSSEEAQHEVVVYLNDELRSFFPTSGVSATSMRVIGEHDVYLQYTNASKKEDCVNNILQNDPAFMFFSIQAVRNGVGFYVEAPTTHSRVLKNAGVKFRKISGQTEMACAVKLVEWFKKNGVAFLKLGLR